MRWQVHSIKSIYFSEFVNHTSRNGDNSSWHDHLFLPHVEVLYVDVSVWSCFPLTPQQETFFGCHLCKRNISLISAVHNALTTPGLVLPPPPRGKPDWPISMQPPSIAKVQETTVLPVGCPQESKTRMDYTEGERSSIGWNASANQRISSTNTAQQRQVNMLWWF